MEQYFALQRGLLDSVRVMGQENLARLQRDTMPPRVAWDEQPNRQEIEQEAQRLKEHAAKQKQEADKTAQLLERAYKENQQKTVEEHGKRKKVSKTATASKRPADPNSFEGAASPA